MFPAGAVDSIEAANDLVVTMCIESVGEPPSSVVELVDALIECGEEVCWVERPADSRGVIVETKQPEDGLLNYLLSETMDRGLAVYDLELFRLYDPRGRVDIDVKIQSDVALPYLTPTLLRDLVLRPTWPRPDDPFFIVERGEELYVQVYRGEDGSYTLEHRDGGADAHFRYCSTEISLLADVMWAWVIEDSRWRTAVAWTPLQIAETDDQDLWRPTAGSLHIAENSDLELTFDDTDGEPFLAYHAGNPDNEKDADGRLIPLGWVLHVSDEEEIATGVLGFDDVEEAAAKAKDHLGPPATKAPRHISLRSEHRDDGSWLNLDATLGDDGSLHINGQDFGPVTRMISSDGEYEYFYTIAAENVPALVIALGGEPGTDIIDLLAQRYRGDASYQLEREIRSSGIDYQFTNYS
ncbi:hypothetical protein A5724_04905 [Mycobacterium sp. ACS1612]|uniref:hypothetical protein n=1 Tax=Mycobacterium sp. ACS1612 TaxID=1834117 RepID=UPI0007FE824C|nr:hypothetical protein [Mycobacterium sp. ACS1612]OBF41674.1 hypothetical protein A5724_04905 [Mycobacterium sp. ACS1612]